MTIEKIFIIYLISINLITLAVYGIDKALAKAGKWRISEAALIWLAVFGGSVGALAGMFIFHHKTKKKKFLISIPLILLLHICLAVWYIFFSNIRIRLLY